MLSYLYVLYFILIQQIFLTSALKCYFQRCKDLEDRGWVCNYNGVGKLVECEPDEVCFEESFPATSGKKRYLRERNCRSTALVGFKLYYLKPFIDAIHPNGGFTGWSNYEFDYAIGNVDLTNNGLPMPRSFELAELTSCYEESCRNDCSEGPCRWSCPKPLRYVYCGSQLDWVCYYRTFHIRGEYMSRKRDCVPIDDLNLIEGTDTQNLVVKNRIDATTSDVYVFEKVTGVPDYDKRHVRTWYCRTPLCNDMNL